ncbi:MAG: hypothetical protein IJG34_00180 [Synergistaceae bacterium]|nr:hypothetical protein [Synergistaceae bacterium]MBQ3448307.1 hypothetical protein [Synergistaceae bacterium]MBQ9628505.1 hypothetical protein [Synergistaceae bacterium]MBR0250046.1 hypothetical protein [Synergistaceae bacterium]
MNFSIRDILSKIKFKRTDRNALSPDKNRKHKENENIQRTGIIYTVWLFILPLISGLVLGYLADAGISYALDKISGTAGMNDSSVSGSQGTSESGTAKRTFDEFLKENPFHISPIKPVVAEAPKPKEEPKPKEKDTTMDKVVLRGTLPGIGGWFDNDGKMDLILVGKSIGRYRLTSVTYREATFRRGRERIIKYITYGPVAEKPKEEEPKPKPAPQPAPANNNTGQIVAAQPGAQEGQISSEMVNQLVQNPFDEMKRIRMRPSEKDGGLEVQWIQNDSILKRLGVQRGDVIKSVNGIPFTNMGDIANSINSLMNSERFDVEVTRGGKSQALRYVVK